MGYNHNYNYIGNEQNQEKIIFHFQNSLFREIIPQIFSPFISPIPTPY